MKIAIGSDHAGYSLKELLKERLTGLGHEVKDTGAFSIDSTDYPEYASRVAKAVATEQAERGVLVCGSGIGVSMTANRVPGVRAVLAPYPDYAKMGRLHNNANVLCLGERYTAKDLAFDILDVFLNTEFEGGRHQGRIDKIDSCTAGD